MSQDKVHGPTQFDYQAQAAFYRRALEYIIRRNYTGASHVAIEALNGKEFDLDILYPKENK
jgi:hypothetical protein